MNRNTYRKTWLRLHRSYQKKITTIFMREVRKIVKGIPIDNLTENTYEAIIRLNMPKDSFEQVYMDAYLQVGLLHGKRVGAGINKELKRFEIDVFANEYRRFLAQWLIDNAGTRIVLVRGSLVDYLIQSVAEGFASGNDLPTITRDLHRLMRSRGFYRWQAARIARTEATAAANYGASIAGQTSGIVLEKEWISSNDPRTRRRPDNKYDHIEVDGQKVAEKGLFNVQGDLIKFPGDPKGNPSNIINCRCAMSLVPKRDRDGRLITKG